MKNKLPKKTFTLDTEKFDSLMGILDHASRFSPDAEEIAADIYQQSIAYSGDKPTPLLYYYNNKPITKKEAMEIERKEKNITQL